VLHIKETRENQASFSLEEINGASLVSSYRDNYAWVEITANNYFSEWKLAC